MGVTIVCEPASWIAEIVGSHAVMSSNQVDFFCQEVGKGLVDDPPRHLAIPPFLAQEPFPALQRQILDVILIALGMVSEPLHRDGSARCAEESDDGLIQRLPVRPFFLLLPARSNVGPELLVICLEAFRKG